MKAGSPIFDLFTGLSMARLKRTVILGIKSLWMHKLRSLLTALGIVFGVCSVIAMLAIGEGASYEAQQQIENLGSQNIILQSIKPTGNDNSAGEERSMILEYGLTLRDIEQIQQTIPGVDVLVPGRKIKDYIWHQSNNVDSTVLGTVPWYPEMRNRKVLEGRFFSQIEMDGHKNVCVLNKSLARKLFPLSSPIGKDVRLRQSYYRVVGIIEARPAGVNLSGSEGLDGTAGGSDEGEDAMEMLMPLSTLRERFGEVLIKYRSGSFEAEKVDLHEITVKIDNPDRVVGASEAIRHLLERNHSKPDYRMVVPLELLRRAERTKQIFNIVLGSIAAISLLVGGIGIMNIMLATVTERTREIGIRRALGAKQRDIVLQFLIETILLSGAGGLIGVVTGVAIPIIIEQFADMITIVRFWAPTLAFTISVMIGVVFGIYPAIRAAKLNPVEALRHE